MSILITGGAGFIGSHLAGRLLGCGREVIVIDNFNDYYSPEVKRDNIKEYLKNPGFKLIEADIRGDLREVFKGHPIEKIVHLAARAGVRASLEKPQLYHDVNVLGTVNLLESCRGFGIKKFIFGSSSSVYGVTSNIPFTEDDPLQHPVSPYAVTKIAGEQLCRIYYECYGIHITCLRFFTVYGPRQRPEMAIHKFVRMIKQARPVPFYGDGDSGRDYTYITDIIEGIVSAMDKDFGFEIINLGDSHVVRLKELVGMIEEVLGREASLRRLPPQPGDVPITYADISKAKRLLAYEPKVSIKNGIGEFVKWYTDEVGGGRDAGI